MKLGDWLQKEGKRASWLARELKVSRQAVYGWIEGRNAPSADRCAAIARITADEVRARDFASDPTEEILPYIDRPVDLDDAA